MLYAEIELEATSPGLQQEAPTDRLAPGTRVKTIEPNMSMRNEWTSKDWKKRQWGVTGEVVGHHDSHRLYYDVKHPDGTMAGYDPSEFEVVVLHAYLLTAEAIWVEEKGVFRKAMHQHLSATFEAVDIEAARLEAQHLLAQFQQGLPQNKGAGIVSTTLALVLDL